MNDLIIKYFYASFRATDVETKISYNSAVVSLIP
jgi:hypothetical protein